MASKYEEERHPAPPAPPAKAHEPAPSTPLRENYLAETKPLAAPGSRDYVAGQPVDEAEQKKVDEEAAAKIKAAQEKARQADHAAADTASKK